MAGAAASPDEATESLTVDDAYALMVRVLKAHGESDEYAKMTADHLIDCELRGLEYVGKFQRPLSFGNH